MLLSVICMSMFNCILLFQKNLSRFIIKIEVIKIVYFVVRKKNKFQLYFTYSICILLSEIVCDECFLSKKVWNSGCCFLPNNLRNNT